MAGEKRTDGQIPMPTMDGVKMFGKIYVAEVDCRRCVNWVLQNGRQPLIDALEIIEGLRVEGPHLSAKDGMAAFADKLDFARKTARAVLDRAKEESS